MGIGHSIGHASNHWSMSSYDWINRFGSITCTCLWGLREKYLEFSHIISHHCYNYTDRDYVMEQHLPMKYFRFRHEDEWKPIHAYQHYMYILTPITSFLMGAIRLDCAPWIIIAPILETFSFLSIRRNHDSIIPAPQFFASGSNVDINTLKDDEDGVGPNNFVVYDTLYTNVVSIILANLIWLPLFITNYNKFGLVHAILFNSAAFGFQASIVVKSLLTHHLCEDIVLQPNYKVGDDWYLKQIEASTTVNDSPLRLWASAAASYQTEHHLFPALNPLLLLKVQPVVAMTAKEFNVQYNHLPSGAAAMISSYKYLKLLSVDPNASANCTTTSVQKKVD
jgi:fatty acid desaturase